MFMAAAPPCFFHAWVGGHRGRKEVSKLEGMLAEMPDLELGILIFSSHMLL